MLLTIDMPIYIQIKNKSLKVLQSGIYLGEIPFHWSDKWLMILVLICTQLINYIPFYDKKVFNVHRKSGVVVNDPDAYKASTDYIEKTKEELKVLFTEVICRGMQKDSFINMCNDIYDYIQNSKKGD